MKKSEHTHAHTRLISDFFFVVVELKHATKTVPLNMLAVVIVQDPKYTCHLMQFVFFVTPCNVHFSFQLCIYNGTLQVQKTGNNHD